MEKYEFLERKFYKKSFKIARFLPINCVFEKSPKIDFLAPKFLNKGNFLSK